MRLAHRILDAIGFTSWERIAEPPVADQIADLFIREETGREPPYGTALDLGCGRGIWAVELARRSQLTGVDLVPRALRRARARAEEAGVETRLLLPGRPHPLGADGKAPRHDERVTQMLVCVG
jgi:SAM-dependent methyltransferase